MCQLMVVYIFSYIPFDISKDDTVREWRWLYVLHQTFQTETLDKKTRNFWKKSLKILPGIYISSVAQPD